MCIMGPGEGFVRESACWRTYYKVLDVLVLVCVFLVFLPSKESMWDRHISALWGSPTVT